IVRQLKSSTKAVIENVYGPSETTVWSTCLQIEDDYQNIPIGKPISNTQIYIVQGNNLCGIGVPGELCIAGDGLARGYLNRPELTAEKFVVNPYGEGRMYHTGDLARWLPDGNIEYLGRIDEQVKIRGFRIELGEISSKLLEIDKVRDCAVIAKEDVGGDKAIYAYYVSDEELNSSDIIKELTKSLPDYMLPSYMMRIDAIPVNKSGKLDRRALPDIEVKNEREYVAPRNKTEKLLCGIFGEILNVEQVSVTDSFFALGGHSLRATRLVNRIEAETGHRIALKAVFTSPTPEKLAELITGEVAEKYVSIPKAEDKEYYPMSSAQKRTYLICQMDPEGVTYNMPQNLRLKGEVRPEAIKDALQQMINRHEILRTQFMMVEGEPVQKILDYAEADFKYIKDDNTPEEELIASFMKPFDLSKSPLVRACLVDRGEYYLLNIDMHHIVGDGMSVGTFIKEFNAFYNNKELAPLTHQFKDYSEWMLARDLSSQAQYWKSQFDDEIPVLDMPLDYSRPQEQSNRGAMVLNNTGSELGRKIKEMAAKNGATEFMVLMSAAMVLLGKYSRQEDVVIGTPISGRTHKDTEGMLGMFINTLAMRGKPEGKKTYEEFLNETRDVCFKAYENQEYPFEELVEAVDVQRDMSRNPIFDVMLVLQNNEKEDIELNGIKTEWAETKDTVAKFDLTFNIWENEGEFGIGLEYCNDLFKEESAKQILEHYITILETLINNPTSKLEEVEMVSESERALVLESFNNTDTDYSCDNTIVEMFEEQVAETPDNVAVVFEGESLIYSELNAKANQVAYKLRELGVKPDDFVAIVAERSLEMIVGIYGIIKAGGAYVPIDPTYPEDRIAYMLEDSAPKAVLVYNAKVNTDIEVIDLANSEVYLSAAKNPERVNKPGDLIYCIYTSGTTGKPKGVMIEHKNACNLAEYMRHELAIDEKDHVMLFANYIFDGSVWEMMSAIMNGASLYIPKDETIKDIDIMKKYVADNKITVSYFPPNYYEQGRFALDKYVITAGSAASRSVVDTILQNSGYINSYGPTEATVCISNWICEKGETPERITIGKPISNVQIYIVQGENICGVGVPGELCVAGAGIARGYLNMPELTGEKFVANPYGEGRMYHTGDLARWLPDGNIEYLGRVDEQVKIRGFRVELGEIESRIRDIRGITDCAVIAKEDASGDKAIYAYMTGEGEISMTGLRDNLSKSLPEYMIPSYMMQIESIPVTRNGKLDKRALPEIEARTGNEYVAPESETEAAVCRAFETMLGIEKVGVYDSFFELGGDSIKAIRVVSKVRSEGYTITVKDILQKRTPKSIALYAVREEENNYYQGEVTGKVQDTHVMRQFKSWSFGKPEHFNQSMMIPVQADTEVIKKALNELVCHHDILRAVYRDGGLEILSYEESRKYDFFEYDLNDCENPESKIHDLCTEIQSGIKLEEGPLMRVGLFDTAKGRYMMICIHHYVVDGVSWRILLEDFDTAVDACQKNQKIKLPAKTASFIEWTELLREYSKTEEVEEEREFWNNFEDNKEAKRLQISESDITDSINNYSRFELSSDMTRNLLRNAGRAYNTQINDLLIAALGIAIRKHTGQESIAVGIEGHGRETIHKPVNTDRTVGWFTSLYPVVVDCKNDIEESIVTTKDMLREVPNNGIGYGLLYDTNINEYVDVYFNYLGEMDSEENSKNSVGLPTGESSSKYNKVPGYLSVNALVSEGKFIC
ncbi:MAG: amino acid adenylation domain-containing protein, partial [Lachnospiraceae bacterium]|nr:amino acid adenylation domain-containing protein [Lachnospiraceae bacterium]